MTVPPPQKSPEPSAEYLGVPLEAETPSSVKLLSAVAKATEATSADLHASLRSQLRKFTTISGFVALVVAASGFAVSLFAIQAWAQKAGADAGSEGKNIAIDTREALRKHVEDEAHARQAMLDELRFQDAQRRETQLDVRALSQQITTNHTPPRLLAEPAPIRKLRPLLDGGVK